MNALFVFIGLDILVFILALYFIIKYYKEVIK